METKTLETAIKEREEQQEVLRVANFVTRYSSLSVQERYETLKLYLRGLVIFPSSPQDSYLKELNRQLSTIIVETPQQRAIPKGLSSASIQLPRIRTLGTRKKPKKEK